MNGPGPYQGLGGGGWNMQTQGFQGAGAGGARLMPGPGPAGFQSLPGPSSFQTMPGSMRWAGGQWAQPTQNVRGAQQGQSAVLQTPMPSSPFVAVISKWRGTLVRTAEPSTRGPTTLCRGRRNTEDYWILRRARSVSGVAVSVLEVRLVKKKKERQEEVGSLAVSQKLYVTF
uniref:Uncharacterized protein n=1 Tax=Chromera velia CCMP2878 TaxID=1169474 RepID=A0A0G4HAS8_9ALVE|eukprot:Cvel_25618.t1-p1 / transcript=Cvel_25618.t1 / gene=Cvel_25618 / organism=Chromera_velia_CCMP2878 / gene_product=hypothetical protein / transcript_product=hypothetical protein / location=Cvel_scaffold2926:8180-15319(+) / protein_length=171 / sequence_SO=supercontig / SO=protein_coding / is_pseudo=false